MPVIYSKIFFAILLALSQLSFSQSSDFYKGKISKYLDKDNALLTYYTITDKSMKIYSSVEAKTKDSCEIDFEYSLVQQSFQQAFLSFNPTKEKPLNGMPACAKKFLRFLQKAFQKSLTNLKDKKSCALI